jgi:hypothetical protein
LGQGVSAYAHNIFLHNFAEMGIAGGLPFLLLIMVAVTMVAKVWLQELRKKAPNPSLTFFLSLSVLGSLINALFDFDWHFFVIFSLTLIFIAFILQSTNKSDSVAPKQSRLPFLVLLAVTTSIMFLYVLALQWQRQQDQRWLQLSFFDRLVRLPHKIELIDEKIYKQQLSFLYRKDPDIWARYLRQEGISSDERLEIFLSLAKLDPSYFAKVVDFSLLDEEQSLKLVPVMLEVFKQYGMIDNVILLDYWWQKELSKQLFMLGEKSFVAGDIGRSVVFYQASYELNKYVFGDHQPSFFQDNDLNKWENFVLLMSDLSPHDSGNFYAYMDLSRQIVQKLFREQEFTRLKAVLRIVLNLEPPAKYFLLNSLRESDLHQEALAEIYQEFDFTE